MFLDSLEDSPADPLITMKSISTKLNPMPLIGVAVENVEASANCATQSPTVRFLSDPSVPGVRSMGPVVSHKLTPRPL